MSNITRIKLNKKQLSVYKEKSIHSNIQPPYKAITYYYSTFGTNNLLHINISGDNKKLFMSIFGEVDYCYTTWYRSYNWFVEFMGAVFTISSSVRGTTYYLVEDGDNKDVDKLCYLFCLEMDKFLTENKNNESKI